MLILQWKKCDLLFWGFFGGGMGGCCFSTNTSHKEENICNCFTCSIPFQMLRRCTLACPLELLLWLLPRFLWHFSACLSCHMYVFSECLLRFFFFFFPLNLTDTYCSFSRMVVLSTAITAACALFLTLLSINFY